MTQKIFKTYLCILCLTFFAGGVQALSITAEPDQIQEGEQITVTIQGLEDSSSFSMHIGAEITPDGNQEFAFSSNKLTMPFDLSNTTVKLQAEPVVWASFRYQQGPESPVKSLKFWDDEHPAPGGIISEKQSFGQINSDSEISVLEIKGKALQDTDHVSVSFELDGVKSGDDNSSISYTINDMKQGTVSIVVSVDGTEALNKKIQVGGEIPATDPTQSPSGNNGDENNYSPDFTTTPDTTLSTSSSDGYATLNALRELISGAEAEDIYIMKNSSPKDIPDEWDLVYGAYIISPASLNFSEPAEFSITGDEGMETNSRFIAEYNDKKWTIIPTELKGDALVAKISEPGTYALMTFGNTESVSETNVPQQTPDSTDVSTATPASTESPAPTPTTSAPPIYAGIFTALGALLLVLRLNK